MLNLTVLPVDGPAHWGSKRDGRLTMQWAPWWASSSPNQTVRFLSFSLCGIKESVPPSKAYPEKQASLQETKYTGPNFWAATPAPEFGNHINGPSLGIRPNSLWVYLRIFGLWFTLASFSGLGYHAKQLGVKRSEAKVEIKSWRSNGQDEDTSLNEKTILPTRFEDPTRLRNAHQ